MRPIQLDGIDYLQEGGTFMAKFLSNIIFIVGVVIIVTSWNLYYILGMSLIILGLLIDPPVMFKTYFKNKFSK